MRSFAGLRRSSSSLLRLFSSLTSGYDSGPKRAFADSELIAIEAEFAVETELAIETELSVETEIAIETELVEKEES